MTLSTFVVFGVIAIIFALLSFLQTSIIKNQKNFINSLKAENAQLKKKVNGLETEIEDILHPKGMIENV